MQIIVTKQIGIEANSLEEAVEKVNKGEGSTISMSANARPQQGQAGAVSPAGRVVTGGFQQSAVSPTPTESKPA